MNKLTKGALTMVLVGAATFSTTNALLADHSFTQLVKGHVSTNSGHPKIADNINQTDKTGKDQTPITHVKDAQPTLSNNIAAPQAVLENGNKSDQGTAMIQKNPTTTSASKTVIAPATNTAPVTNMAPATNTTANSNITATASTKSSSANVSKTSTTTTNHGKQISQAAKDKAASH